MSWKDFPEKLLAEQPIFAVGLAGDTPPWQERATLPEIAGHFVELLRGIQMTGPFHIMGHSFGGMLAYEVACQLREAGAEVGLVLVLDTGPEQLRTSSPWTVLKNLPRFLANLPQWISQFMFRTTASHKFYEIRRKLRTWRRQLFAVVTGRSTVRRLDAAIDTRRLPDDIRKRMESNYNAFQFYEPGAYSGRLVLFRAMIRPLFNGFTPDLAWRRLVTGGVEVIDIPGNHISVLEKPNSEILAVQLQSVLDRDAGIH